MQPIGFVLQTLGELLIAITVLRVHSRMKKEHKIDGVVLSELKEEQRLGHFGIALLAIGFLLQLPSIL
ncbi:hypothetical protein FJZ48_04320 [Candidatus Uhrbacteria bacterium]|nr:hypothetical protein [Candidatus Uhrbacteria bacterium]